MDSCGTSWLSLKDESYRKSFVKLRSAKGGAENAVFLDDHQMFVVFSSTVFFAQWVSTPCACVALYCL